MAQCIPIACELWNLLTVPTIIRLKVSLHTVSSIMGCGFIYLIMYMCTVDSIWKSSTVSHNTPHPGSLWAYGHPNEWEHLTGKVSYPVSPSFTGSHPAFVLCGSEKQREHGHNRVWGYQEKKIFVSERCPGLPQRLNSAFDLLLFFSNPNPYPNPTPKGPNNALLANLNCSFLKTTPQDAHRI